MWSMGKGWPSAIKHYVLFNLVVEYTYQTHEWRRLSPGFVADGGTSNVAIIFHWLTQRMCNITIEPLNGIFNLTVKISVKFHSSCAYITVYYFLYQKVVIA